MQQNNYRWGATPQDWQYWAFAVGAGADLLPAVANPAAAQQRSPRLQHLDSLAKTPSWIGSNGVAYGVAGWVAHQANPEMVRQWSANPDYNILLITRNIRAIDIDIGDAATAQALERFIVERLGVRLPVRTRANSGKRTLLLRIDPHIPIRKRVIKTRAGNIEFLADGQQTALCGTHPSGARFELAHLDAGVPAVNLRQLEGLWDELRNAYDPAAKPLVVVEEQQAEYIVRTGGTLRDDPILQWLENEGWVLGYEPNGTANIRCPWEHEHSEGGNPNATSWLPAGLGGKDRGGFRCLHAHCEGRHTGLFLEKIGYTMSEVNKAFAPTASGGQVSPLLQLTGGAALVQPSDPLGAPADVRAFTGVPMPGDAAQHRPADLDPFTGVPLPTAAPPGIAAATALMPMPLPKGHSVVEHVQPSSTALRAIQDAQNELLVAAALKEAGRVMERDDKTGKPLKKQSNLLACFVTMPQALRVRTDEFRHCTEVSFMGGEWQAVTDNIISKVRIMVERAIGHTFERGDISNALDLAGALNSYDSAAERLHSLQWDGKQRLATFDRDILRTGQSDYSQAVGFYMWVAMAGRVLQPGAKADIAPVMISPNQGTGKSSFVEAMALDPSWYGKINLEDKDENVVRKIQGKIVVEVPELRGLTGRDASSTKDFLSTATDSWVPKFKEKAIEAPRRCLFIGTDNRLRILTDPTGNRRWAPLRVATTAPFLDWPRMQAEIEQYWAEAVAIVRQFASPEAAIEHFAALVRKLAGPAIAAATVLDPWSPAIERFALRQTPRTHISLELVYRDVFGGALQSLDRIKAFRIRDVMTALGYVEVATDTWETPAAQTFI